jgi:hypothetical protein
MNHRSATHRLASNSSANIRELLRQINMLSRLRPALKVRQQVQQLKVALLSQQVLQAGISQPIGPAVIQPCHPTQHHWVHITVSSG